MIKSFEVESIFKECDQKIAELHENTNRALERDRMSRISYVGGGDDYDDFQLQTMFNEVMSQTRVHQNELVIKQYYFAKACHNFISVIYSIISKKGNENTNNDAAIEFVKKYINDDLDKKIIKWITMCRNTYEHHPKDNLPQWIFSENQEISSDTIFKRAISILEELSAKISIEYPESKMTYVSIDFPQIY